MKTNEMADRTGDQPTNWPFPPLTGAIPWTPEQIKEYEQRALQQDALF